MSFDFPNTPTLGQAYGNYVWDGEKWQLPKGVTPDRATIYAAPFDALAYNGMQINGSMEVSQEYGTGGVAIPMLATGVGLNPSPKYIMDGWGVAFTGGGTGSNLLGHSVATGPTGFTKCLQVYSDTHPFVIGAGDNLVVRQMIEGYRVSRLGFGTASAQSITIAFWVRADAPGTGQMAVTLRNNDVSRNITKNVTGVNVSWSYMVLTFPGDTSGTWTKDNSKGLWLDFTLAAHTSLLVTPDVWSTAIGFGSTGQANFLSAAGNGIQITGVVVLPGIEAPSAARSPLIMRPYDQELLTCQRYYEKTHDYASVVNQATPSAAVLDFISSNNVNRPFVVQRLFGVRKRVTPTGLVYSYQTGAVGNVRNDTTAADAAAIISCSETMWSLVTTASQATNNQLRYNVVADARL